MKQIRHIVIPAQAHTALRVIERAGYEAWLVGGFVRDALRGIKAHDLDIATNARWESVRALFSKAGFAVHETGVKHGTVTVVVDGLPIEVTTFRTEGAYSDSRHPDSVIFVDRIETDLARRDFTMNAIAYHPERGFVDPYGGRAAIENRLIECVGDPFARFSEDALRIMRGIRFAAQLGFSVHPDTAEAMHAERRGLENVACERIQDELVRFLSAPCVKEAFALAAPIVETVIPELGRLSEYEAKRMGALLALAPREPHARYAALFLGSERTDAGNATKNALRRLRVKKSIAAKAELLVESADMDVAPRVQDVHRFVVCLNGDADLARCALELQHAVRIAPHAECSETGESACLAILGELVAKRRPFALRDLAISGSDVIGLGVAPGPEVRHVLQAVFERCVEDDLPNTRKALLPLVSELKSE